MAHSSSHSRDDQDMYVASVAFTILPFIPLAAWFLVVGWSPNTTEGEVLFKVPVPLLARLKMLSIPLSLGLAVLIAGIIMNEVSWWLLLVLGLVYIVVVSIPVTYTLTMVGIRTGKGIFRRWTEFAGVRRSPRGATLQGGPRATSYPVFLSGGREDDDFVHTLRILVRDSYKGKAVIRESLRGNSPQLEGETNTTSSMSH